VNLKRAAGTINLVAGILVTSKAVNSDPINKTFLVFGVLFVIIGILRLSGARSKPAP
jgi:hypothetical protein